jgi:hypothetical protein
MKALFTVHAGEFLVGDYIERKFRRVGVWVPTKDTGVDLLVQNGRDKRVVSLQVKFSRDYLNTNRDLIFQKSLRACGWYTLRRQKIVASPADYWIFVLLGFGRRSADFVIIRPPELLKRLDAIHRNAARIQSYFWVTEKDRCWETRDLRHDDHLLIAGGKFKNAERDFTDYLNNWQPIRELNG